MSGTGRILGAIPYVFCADAAATSDWLVRVLGFTERERWSNDAGAVTNVELVLGGAEVWLDGPVPDWSEGRGTWVGLKTDNVDAIYERLHELGESTDPPVERGFGVRMLTVADPEGRQWGFVERTEDAS